MDHGTALDIAGKNLADPSSLGIAFTMASDIANTIAQAKQAKAQQH